MSTENKNNNSKKLTANILFSGIGCQERGFENSGLFDIDVLNTSDINKESVLSYAAIHCGMTNEMVNTYSDYPSREEMAQYLTDINLGYVPEKDKKFDWFKLIKKKSNDLEKYWLACKLTNNRGDISKIEELPYADFWTCSFPCTDISVAGKMKGLDPDSGTRSSLLWENIRLLKKAKDNNELPKYIMVENVKNLVSKKFIGYFNDLIEVFNDLGFNTYWSVLNGKDCGIPQNRERVFVIAIRKDIDNGSFSFPQAFDTGIRLKDILEDSVDEKYYLSEVATRKFKMFDETKGADIQVAGSLNPDKNVQDRVRVLNIEGISQGLRATDYKDPVKIVSETATLKQAGQLYGTEKEPNPQAGRVYNSECLSPTLDTFSGGNRMLKIVESKLSHSEWKQKMYEQFIKDADGEVSGVITNQSQTFGYRPPMKGYSKTLRANANDTGIVEDYRIRKLTPRECYKLMGLTFEDCDKAKNIGVADSHLYKQAGNGIITNCCELLAEHLYKAQYDNTYICTDEKIVNNQSNFDTNSIIVRGNYMPSNHDASRIVDENGIAPCVKENHGTVTGVVRNFQQPQVD